MRIGVFLSTLLLAIPAWGVSTSHWTQQGESDFKAGTTHNVVITNLGDVKLSREVKTLMENDPKVGAVTSLAQAADGTIYAGTAPQGILLAINPQSPDNKISTAATIDGAVSINALVAEKDGGLLLGVSGMRGKVLRIDKSGDAPREIFAEKDVQYIWALAEAPDGMIYAATGPNGQLFAIHPDGRHEQIYKSDETNLTALISDGKDLLYVGTDPDGLVVRINRQTNESFILYNATEEEIAALAMDQQGNLYAATGQVPAQDQAQQPAENTQKEESSGRPETTPAAQPPLPSQPPTPPKPPSPAPPNPGQPPPLPKGHAMLLNVGDESAPKYLVTTGDESPADGGDAEDQPTPVAPGGPNQPGGAGEHQLTPAKPLAAGGEEAEAKSEGNAVYKIDKDGFVTEVFRDQVVIYSMVGTHSGVLIGTGEDGEIYQVDPAAGETVVLADSDSKEITAMLTAADGSVILGLANSGGVSAMTDGTAHSGTYTGPVFDATQASRFGVIQMHGTLPSSTTLTVATRSGNVKDEDSQGWSKWSSEIPAAQFVQITSPNARFLQYRLTFGSSDGKQTPVIGDVDVAYQMPNLPPAIKSIKITDAASAAAAGAAPAGAAAAGAAKSGDSSTKSAGTGQQTITWDASDPNDDNLVYSLYFRTGGGPWILLKDNLTDSTYTWDTHGVADGRYEVKVVASDELANPVGQGKTTSRMSDPLVVDNTPPVIGDLQTSVNGNSAEIKLRATVQNGTIASMEYSVDSNDNWQTVLPVDNIFDRPEESVDLAVSHLTAGVHQITLRATDSSGNVAYQTVNVTVGK
jgi:hypothetical protein